MANTTETTSNGMLRTSTTFPTVDGLEKKMLQSKIAMWCDFALEAGEPVHFISNPGIGKTSFTRDYFAGKGLNVLSLHLPTTDPDVLSVALPQDGPNGTKVLEPVVLRQLREADVIICDETRRAKESVRNNLMEMIQNKSLGGQALKEGVTFVLLNNWSNESGVSSSGVDLAQESRYITIELRDKDVPWQIALASAFDGTDMTEAFKVYNNLERDFPGISSLMSPRTFEHVMWNILNDLPGELGLPLLAGPRAWLINKDGDNVTDLVMQKLAAAVNKPFIKTTPEIARKALVRGVQHGKNVMLQGNPGIGKTEYVKQIVREEEINDLYWSMQNVTPDEHVVPFPSGDDLELMLSKVVQPLDGEPYVLIADEYYRAKAPVLNMMLEVTQGGTLGGQKVPVQAVIAMTNPRMIAGQRQSVGKPDRAMADRFFINVDLKDDDVPANEFLLNKYGDIASPFVEWWKEDLDDLGRLYTPKRVLEKMIKVFQGLGGDTDLLDYVLPYLKEEYVPVPLHDLKLRLSNRPVARLKAVIEDKDTYIERMNLKTPEGTNADQEAHITVSRAIQLAEVSQLSEKETFDDLVELIAPLDRSHRTALVKGQSGPRLKACSNLVRAAGKLAKQQTASK